MTDIHNLPPVERALRYEALAQEAEGNAAKSLGAIRDAYELIARQWRALAATANRGAT